MPNAQQTLRDTSTKNWAFTQLQTIFMTAFILGDQNEPSLA